MMAHRKALVAAAAVAAVLVAGAVAVGANVGILDGGNGGLGELSAASASSSGPTAVASAVRSSPADASATSGVQQTFEVDEAGSVTLTSDGPLLSLDSVRPADGWSWTTDQRSDSELSVELTDGARTLVLVASADGGGEIRARVEDGSAASDTPAAAVSGSQDDREHEEREHEEREHGDDHREDDEHHEYEGHDDDD